MTDTSLSKLKARMDYFYLNCRDLRRMLQDKAIESALMAEGVSYGDIAVLRLFLVAVCCKKDKEQMGDG